MDERRHIFNVLKAQSGDRKALDDLFRSVQERLFRCIFQIVGQRDTAEDVLQDVSVILQKRNAVKSAIEPDDLPGADGVDASDGVR